MTKHFLTYSIFFLLLFSGYKFAIAQGSPRSTNQGTLQKEAIITGVIKDASTNQSIPYASVALYKSADSTLVTGVLSNDDGSFTLDKLPYGKYYIIVTFVGYKKHKVFDLILTPSQKIAALGTVKVTTSVTNLKEVEIVGNAPPVSYRLDKKVVNIERNITAEGATLAEALQHAPSIQSDIEGNITMRGSSNYTVLIDGRPSPIAGSEALQQMPASLVQDVELITNPSAKYEAEGSAGIINIILKKQNTKGSSGIFNISAGTGNKYSSNLNLSYKIAKFTFTIGGDFTDNQSPFKNNMIAADTLINQVLKRQVTTGSGNLHREGRGVRGVIDYDPNDRNSFTLTGNFGHRNFIRSTDANYHDIYGSPINPVVRDIYYDNSTHPNNERDYSSLNLDYQLKFAKKDELLSAAVYFTGGQNNTISDLQTDTTDIHGNSIGKELLIQRTTQYSDQTDLRTKVDYSLPVKDKGKFEAGYQGKYSNTNGDYHLTNFKGNTWIEDVSQMDKLDFKDQIQAAYVTFSNSIHLFDYKFGLRTEYEERSLIQETQQKENRMNRIDFFPTLHLSRQLPWQLQLQTSYTRRINRPNQLNLNPFVQYIDPQNIRQGNPGLSPEFANSYELSLQKQFNDANSVSVEGYIRQTTGLIQQISLYDPATQIATNTFANIDHDRSTGTEFMVNLQIFKWMELNSSFDIFNYHLFGTPIPSVVNNTNTWNIHVNPTLHLGKTTTLQLNYTYNAPTITSQGTRSGFYTSTIALKKSILNRKGSLSLQARNLIGNTIMNSITQTSNQYKYNSFQRESQVFLITFNYRFSNYKVKQREKQNQDESENTREQDMEENQNF